MALKRPTKTLSFDPQRVQALMDDLMNAFKKHRPTVGEIVVALGNLSYNLGHSIGRHGDKMFTPDELQRAYLEKPGAIDIALMSQGMIMTAWYEDWAQIKLEENLGKTKDGN